MTGKAIGELRVGDHAEMTRQVTAELVAGFVTLSGDRNPIHTDAEFAASTPFHEPIAPGMLAASLIAAVIGSELPGPGAVYLSQTLKFLRPVLIGDTLTAQVRVTEILQERNRACLQTSCVNQAGEQVVVGEAWVKPPAAARQPSHSAAPLSHLARAA